MGNWECGMGNMYSAFRNPNSALTFTVAGSPRYKAIN